MDDEQRSKEFIRYVRIILASWLVILIMFIVIVVLITAEIGNIKDSIRQLDNMPKPGQTSQSEYVEAPEPIAVQDVAPNTFLAPPQKVAVTTESQPAAPVSSSPQVTQPTEEPTTRSKEYRTYEGTEQVRYEGDEFWSSL